MEYTLKVKGGSRKLFIPNGAQVVLIFPTRLGVTDTHGLESTIDLPAVRAIIDQYGGEVAVATGTVLHGGDSDTAAIMREPVRVPVIL